MAMRLWVALLLGVVLLSGGGGCVDLSVLVTVDRVRTQDLAGSLLALEHALRVYAEGSIDRKSVV